MTPKTEFKLSAIAGDDNGGASITFTLTFDDEDKITDEVVLKIRDLTADAFVDQFESDPQSVIVWTH